MKSVIINSALIFFRLDEEWKAFNYFTNKTLQITTQEMQLLSFIKEEHFISREKTKKLFRSLLKKEILLKSKKNEKATNYFNYKNNWHTFPDFLFHTIHHSKSESSQIRLLSKKETTLFLEKPTYLTSLAGILNKRRSYRRFSNRPISFNEISQLLGNCLMAQGKFRKNEVSLYEPLTTEEKTKLNRKIKYPFPIGGAISTFDFHLISSNVKGLKRNSIYYYNPNQHTLVSLASTNLRNLCSKLFLKAEWPSEAAFILLISTTPSKRKAYRHSYKMALVEAGHVIQNLYLMTTEMGLGCCEMGGLDQESILKLLNPSGNNKTVPIAAVAIGKK